MADISKEAQYLLDMIKIVSEGSMKSDTKILDAMEQIASKTKDIILILNDKIVDMDERLHRLEDRMK